MMIIIFNLVIKSHSVQILGFWIILCKLGEKDPISCNMVLFVYNLTEDFLLMNHSELNRIRYTHCLAKNK